MPTEPTLPVSQPKRLVSHEQARQAYNHMHGALFNGKSVPCLSIPPQPGDVDIILCDYIDQQAERDRELQQARGERDEALRHLDKVAHELTETSGKLDNLARLTEPMRGQLSEAREEIARFKDGMHQVILVLTAPGNAPQSKAIKMLAELKSEAALHPVAEKPKS